MHNVVLLEWSEVIPKYIEINVWSKKHRIWRLLPPMSAKSILLDNLDYSTTYEACLVDSRTTLSCTAFITSSFFYTFLNLFSNWYIFIATASVTYVLLSAILSCWSPAVRRQESKRNLEFLTKTNFKVALR